MIVPVNNRPLRLPDFFIVGAARGGTTSLYSYLKQHPQVFLPDKKEPYFFAFNGEGPRFKLADGSLHEKVGCTQAEYYEMYANSPRGYVLGDPSTWYLYFYEEVIKNIKALYCRQAEKAKIIMVLRSPVERAWSHYCMHQRAGFIDIPFLEAISPGPFQNRIQHGYYPSYDYIGFGMYSRQVQAYLEAFNDVKIIIYEDFRNDSQAVVNDIVRFLGLEPVGNLDTKKRLNVSGTPRSSLAAVVGRLIYRPNFLKKLIIPLIPSTLGPKIKMGASRFIYKKTAMNPKDRQVLIDIYRKDILRLQQLLGRDLSAWLER